MSITNLLSLLLMSLFQHPDFSCLEIFHTSSFILMGASNHFMCMLGLVKDNYIHVYTTINKKPTWVGFLT